MDAFLSDQAYARIADAPPVSGNSVRLLKDATENYPAWLHAIGEARRSIYLESYFIREDDIGREFAAAVAAKAREGITVRIIYDWFGALGFTSRRFWRRLREAGVEVRCFNPPRFGSPFGWLSRDHRKMLTVDGELGFVFGLCVDQRWAGDQKRGVAPWRDTGIEIRGPAIAALDRTFAHVWEVAGRPIPPNEQRDREAVPRAGDASMCVIAGSPHSARLYRLDQLVAANARRSLWLTDAYFVPTTPYAQALCAAAINGVDVRLLIPGLSDVPFTRAMIITNQLGLNPSEALVMAVAGLIVLASVVIIALWPWVVAGPLVAVGCWVALALLARAYRLFSEGKRQAELRPAPACEEAKPERASNW